VEREFLRRLDLLPVATRRALLVAATSDVGELRVLSPALEALQLDPISLEPAEAAGLVAITSSVDFCHPLARSAIYGAAQETSAARPTSRSPMGPTRARRVGAHGTSPPRRVRPTRRLPRRS